MFGELAKSVKAFEVGEPEYLKSAFINGINSIDCNLVLD